MANILVVSSQNEGVAGESLVAPLLSNAEFSTSTMPLASALRQAENKSCQTPDLVVVTSDHRLEPEPLEALLAACKRKKIPVFALLARQDAQSRKDLLERGLTGIVTLPLNSHGLARLRTAAVKPFSGAGDWVRRLSAEFQLDEIIGEAESFRREIEKIPVFASSEAPVLIYGETGTGKELAARALHYLSNRADGPFVPVNCGAIPLELMESELFGHEKAAFTGAAATRRGLIEEASSGTLFLDELDSLPPAAQVKLLRFLQEGEFRHLGSNQLLSSNTRILAAMSTRPRKAIRQGALRSDIYYRLSVLSLELPPLRKRRTDILLLARHFLKQYCACEVTPRLSESARTALLNCSWEGNVRELQHVIQRAALLSTGDTIEAEDLGLDADEATDLSYSEAKNLMVAKFERSFVDKTLALTRGNVSAAARKAGRSRRGFWNLVLKHNIDVSRYRRRSVDG